MKTFEGNKFKLTVEQDESPFSPREDDNLGTMVCFHSRYNLGDKHDYKHEYFSGWDEMRKAIIKKENAAIVLPLYLYNHSGLTISTSPFSCRWDSGQVGFIFISKEKILKEYGGKRVTKKLVEKVTEYLISEVKTYDQYLTGDVYGFKLLNKETLDEDSCWGFYGSNVFENGIIDYIGEEAQEDLKTLLEAEYPRKKELEKV
jgi:hypothetical protein